MSKKLQIFQMYEDRVESSFYPEEQITEDELSELKSELIPILEKIHLQTDSIYSSLVDFSTKMEKTGNEAKIALSHFSDL